MTLRPTLALALALVVAGTACANDTEQGSAEREPAPTATSSTAAAVPSGLTPTVDHPFVAFATVTRSVYEGEEVDPDAGERVQIRVESVVRPDTKRVAGTEVTVVEVKDFESGDLVELTEDYYAQGPDGVVYYLGEQVDEYEDGEVAGHGGEWLTGEGENQAGVFMPADPAEGDVFEQERAPGVAEDRSTVVGVGVTVTVPAGTFDDCIETEDLDPIDDVTEHKFYCRGVGLVRETFAAGGSLDLIEFSSPTS